MRILSVSQNFLIAATALVLLCCQKENSSIGTGTAAGTLKHSSGVCNQAIMGGTYTQGVPLSSSNTVTVEVTVTTPGTYNITTNTINGVSFSMSGTFTGTGVKSVILTGSGTPVNTGSKNYTVIFGSSNCDFSITFATGTAAATGTLGGSAGSCTPVTPAGTYTQLVTLMSANTVQVQVNIVTEGSYTIATNTVNGIKFSASGTFSTIGVQNIILAGTGTPVNAGSQVFTVTFDSSSCNFSLTFLPVVPATGSLAGSPGGCSPVITAGIYSQGLALTSVNTAQVQVNVATAGTYTISTSIGNGISFSKSGTFTTTGLQNVALTGTGIPANASSQNYTVTFGTSVCNFSIAFGTAGSPIDHFPTTINSYWVYGFGPGPGVGMGDGLRINVVSSMLTAGGNTYSTLNADDSTNHYQYSLFYRKAGGEYFEYINTKSFFGLDGSGTPPNMEYTFLKDNVPQGSTWNTPPTTGTIMGGTPYSIYLKMTILEKAVTATISAVTFTDVIKVRYEGIATMALGTFTEFTQERWFAKNIGEIYHSFHDGVSQFDYYRIANYQVL